MSCTCFINCKHCFKNSLLKKFFLSLIALYSIQLLAQDTIEVSGGLELGGFAFQENLPFWLHTNSGGFINSETNIAGRAQIYADYDITRSHKLQLGLGWFYRDGLSQNFQRNDLFIYYENSIINATLGSKEVADNFQGLGVVRNSFSLSGNARALPGLNISLAKPLKIIDNFSIDAAIAHYVLNDDRIVDNARVHNKKLDIIWNFKPNNSLTAGIEHFSQWAGNSSIAGQQPSDFSAFIDVFFARSGGEEASTNDQLNSLGNSLGFYKLAYDLKTSSGKYSLYHHHPFEDGSGTRLRNFPDGIWGFYYTLDDTSYTSVLEGFLLEYVSTVSQSGRFGRSGRDSYFNNRIYRSGWTYEGNVIGLPFIDVPDNTRIEAFHFGLNVAFGKWKSRFKGSYVRSLGTFFNAINPTRRQVFLSTQHNYYLSNSSILQLDLGYDFNNSTSDIFGVGASYKINF